MLKWEIVGMFTERVCLSLMARTTMANRKAKKNNNNDGMPTGKNNKNDGMSIGKNNKKYGMFIGRV